MALLPFLPDNSLAGGGKELVLYMGGCLTASKVFLYLLGTTTTLFPTIVMRAKNVSTYCQVSPGLNGWGFLLSFISWGAYCTVLYRIVPYNEDLSFSEYQ